MFNTHPVKILYHFLRDIAISVTFIFIITRLSDQETKYIESEMKWLVFLLILSLFETGVWIFRESLRNEDE